MTIDLTGIMPRKAQPKFCNLIKKANAELDEENRKIFDEALADQKNWSSNGLAEALRNNGFIVHKNSVGDHRKGACACTR
jgi:hypothetical protein